MANGITKIGDLINPQVMADMISAKIPSKIVVSPFAKVDTTLQGVPGDTITVPKYEYIGDATDIAEGDSVATSHLAVKSHTVTIKKAMKAVSLTDEAVLSGYGDPVGEANSQLAKAIASKIDTDAMGELQKSTLVYDGTDIITYEGIVDAIDLFEEEGSSEKVMFVHPKQITQLRKDADFISADKYPENVIMSGEIGQIAGTRIVPSKRVLADEDGACYICPIVKLNGESETEDEIPALTIYLKRSVNVESERHTLNRTTDISIDEFYAVSLSNADKVVLAKFLQETAG